MPLPRLRLAATSARYSRVELPPPDELLQPLVRLLRARDDEQAGRVAVEAVDDARPVLLPARGAAAASACASVPPAWPGAGMDDDAGGLVHDEEVLVRVGDRELGRRDLRLRRGRRRRLDLDLLPARELVALAARPPSTSTAPAASSRSAAPREPTSGSAAR